MLRDVLVQPSLCLIVQTYPEREAGQNRIHLPPRRMDGSFDLTDSPLKSVYSTQGIHIYWHEISLHYDLSLLKHAVCNHLRIQSALDLYVSKFQVMLVVSPCKSARYQYYLIVQNEVVTVGSNYSN